MPFYTSNRATSLVRATKSTSVNFQAAAAIIKDTLPLSQLVMETGVELKKRGGEWVGCCPFHDEKTPSFSVNDQKGLYYCRGNCGAKGDVISYFAQMNGLEPGDAIVMLSRRLGIALDERKHKAKAPVSDNYRQQLLNFQTELAEVAHDRLLGLMTDPDHPVSQYLYERGLTRELVAIHRLGFLTPSQSFTDFLAMLVTGPGDNRERERMAQICGLQYRGQSQSPFQGRLLFPIHDRQGKVCAFSGRVIPGVTDPEAAKQKYRNSPDTPVFDKSTTLYGMTPNTSAMNDSAISQRWRQTLGRSVCFLVEGYTDVIALQSAGFMAVAAMGTSITDYQLRYLMARYDKLIVLTDGDSAGQKALNRTLLTAFPLLKEGQRIQGIVLDRGDDPDSVVGRCGGDRRLIRQTLQSCRTVNPESVWLSEVVGEVSNPIALGDQVRIEQGLNSASVPEDPAYKAALLGFLEKQTGYRPGVSGQFRSQTGSFAKLNPDSTDLGRYWLVRLAHHPSMLATLMPRYRQRWWYKDALRGLLASNLELPASLRLLIVADDALAGAAVSQWPGALYALLNNGFPSVLAERWYRIAFVEDDPVLASYRGEAPTKDLWEAEWREWLDCLDARLTSALVQALSD